MEPPLIEDLEKKLTDEELKESICELNEFEDEDLAKYPAIEIKKLNLTALECKTIADNILEAIRSADASTIEGPARALIVLAYNSLMDPQRPFSRLPSGELDRENTPLFQLDKYEPSESWFRTSGVSDIDLREYLTPVGQDEGDSNLGLKLIRLDANEFERKASIGVWAFYHLRLMVGTQKDPWSTYQNIYAHNLIREFYDFDMAYQFTPRLFRHKYELMVSYFMGENKPGELLHLLYRSIMIRHGSESNPAKKLLRGLVFNARGLEDGHLALWNWTKSAASSGGLDVSVRTLFEEFDRVLSELDDEDLRFKKYTSVTRHKLANLREFHRKYIEATYSGDTRRSKYFMYARLVDDSYFRGLKLSANRELICALMLLVERKGSITIKSKPMRPPWGRWGDEMGARIWNSFARRAEQFDRAAFSGIGQNRW